MFRGMNRDSVCFRGDLKLIRRVIGAGLVSGGASATGHGQVFAAWLACG